MFVRFAAMENKNKKLATSASSSGSAQKGSAGAVGGTETTSSSMATHGHDYLRFGQGLTGIGEGDEYPMMMDMMDVQGSNQTQVRVKTTFFLSFFLICFVFFLCLFD